MDGITTTIKGSIAVGNHFVPTTAGQYTANGDERCRRNIKNAASDQTKTIADMRERRSAICDPGRSTKIAAAFHNTAIGFYWTARIASRVASHVIGVTGILRHNGIIAGSACATNH